MTLRRRELLTWAGLAAGGLFNVGCAGKGLRERSPLSPPSQAEFTFLASPSGTVEVLTREGESLGLFEPDVLEDTLRQMGESSSDAASQEQADFARLLSLPGPLIPLSRYSLSHFRALEVDDSMALLVAPSAEAIREFQTPRVVPAADTKFRLDQYFIRISIEKHYLGGCIKRNAWHVGALVHRFPVGTLSPRSGNMMFDLHIASWWERNRPCFAIYESKKRFCRNICDYPSWDAIVVVLYAALATGLAAWLAKALASAIAAASVGALIAIPGVPPPP